MRQWAIGAYIIFYATFLPHWSFIVRQIVLNLHLWKKNRFPSPRPPTRTVLRFAQSGRTDPGHPASVWPNFVQRKSGLGGKAGHMLLPARFHHSKCHWTRISVPVFFNSDQSFSLSDQSGTDFAIYCFCHLLWALVQINIEALLPVSYLSMIGLKAMANWVPQLTNMKNSLPWIRLLKLFSSGSLMIWLIWRKIKSRWLQGRTQIVIIFYLPVTYLDRPIQFLGRGDYLMKLMRTLGIHHFINASYLAYTITWRYRIMMSQTKRFDFHMLNMIEIRTQIAVIIGREYLRRFRMFDQYMALQLINSVK